VKKISSHIILGCTLVMLFFPCRTHGQNNTIKGFINDADSRQPVPLANVVVTPPGSGTVSNEEGYYLVHKLPAGEVILKVTCVGYDSVTEQLTMKSNMTLIRNIYLRPVAYDLGEFNVSARKERVSQRKISEVKVIPAEIALTPSMGGMPDLIQHIQTLPGIVTRGDIGGQVYIRGGTPVQTKVLLDDAVIYNPVHSIGLFSVFDNDYIRNVDLYTGGFNAEYGSCLSSVIDISTRLPNTARWSGKADISTIAAKALIEGPLLTDSTLENLTISAMLSVKASYFEQATDWFYPYVEQELPFYFRDIYGKVTAKLGKSFSMSLSGYSFRDEVSETNTFQTYDWDAKGFSLNLLTMPAEVPILIKTYIAGSGYQMNLSEPNQDNRYSKVSSIAVGMKFYRYLARQTAKYGIEFTDLRTNYMYFTSDYTTYEQGENSGELSGYLDYEGNFGWVIFEAGFRGAFYTSLMRFSPEPRLSVRFMVTENLALKVAAGMYAQNLIGAVSDKDIVNFFQGYLSAPVDMVSASGKDPNDFYLQKANHLVAGVEYDFRSKVRFNVEAYYKDYTQLISFNKNKLFNEDDNPGAPSYMSGTFISETGFAEGIEITVKYTESRLNMEANYSLAMVKRRYTDPDGEVVEYFPQYDRRHNVNFSGMFYFGKNRSWTISARWNYGSGFPFTPTAGYYEGITFDEYGKYNYLTQNGQMNILYGPYNSKRLPAYHRLDMALKKSFTFRNRNTIEAEISVINVYNQENIFYINRETNEEAYQLPILPGLRISYAF
jgi:hypothetical protein